MQAGDRLLNDDGSWAEVSSVTLEAEALVAYNLSVNGWHTYFVAGSADAEPVWVHNDCRPVPQHVFDGHVGKTDSFLARRLDNERIDQASTFTSQQAAQRLTNSVLDSSGGQRRIGEFLDNPDLGNRLTLNSNDLDITFNRPTGNTVLRGNRTSQPANGVRLLSKEMRLHPKDSEL